MRSVDGAKPSICGRRPKQTQRGIELGKRVDNGVSDHGFLLLYQGRDTGTEGSLPTSPTSLERASTSPIPLCSHAFLTCWS